MSIGHKARGGGATIKNSPITVHVHFYMNVSKEPMSHKIRRLMGWLFRRHHICYLEPKAIIDQAVAEQQLSESLGNLIDGHKIRR